MKKSVFTEKTKNLGKRVLHQIVALKDFADVKAGDLGGWIESEENLSHDGDCWVYDNAIVYMGAKIYDNAKVRDNAVVYADANVYGNAEISGNANVHDPDVHVCDKARVMDNANVSLYSKVYENATVMEHADLTENAWIYGEAYVYGNSHISGNAKIHGKSHVYDSQIYDKADIYGDSNVRGCTIYEHATVCDTYLRGITVADDAWIGSKKDFAKVTCCKGILTFYRCKDDIIRVAIGASLLTFKEFKEQETDKELLAIVLAMETIMTGKESC